MVFEDDADVVITLLYDAVLGLSHSSTDGLIER